MAITPDEQKQITKALLKHWSRKLETLSNMEKQVIYNAVADADTWILANSSSFNSALNAQFRTNASNDQKALLLSVLAAFYVSPEFAQAILEL